MMVFIFFFQAEDGIRDVAVTGVQTCALPISQAAGAREREGVADDATDAFEGVDFLLNGNLVVGARLEAASDADVQAFRVLARSEERRVGKECRSLWSLYH